MKFGRRIVTLTLAALICILIGIGLGIIIPVMARGGIFSNFMGSALKDTLQPPPVVNSTMQWLKSDDLMFMVTNRVVTQIVVEQKQNSLLAGTREGVLIATVRMYYGVNIANVNEADILDAADKVIIKLPPPKVLDFAIDPTFKIITKRSGVNVLIDWFYGNDIEMELRQQIKTQALKFAETNKLFPDSKALLTRLNKQAELFGNKIGKPVEFTFDQLNATSNNPPIAQP